MTEKQIVILDAVETIAWMMSNEEERAKKLRHAWVKGFWQGAVCGILLMVGCSVIWFLGA